jgi:hypothetical protein
METARQAPVIAEEGDGQQGMPALPPAGPTKEEAYRMFAEQHLTVSAPTARCHWAGRAGTEGRRGGGAWYGCGWR